MRIVKIKAKYYKNLYFMYEDLGLTQSQEKTDFKLVNPSKVLVAKEDYAKMRKEAQKIVKKEKPFLSARSIKKEVDSHLLNIGPNELAGAAVRPGYLIILD